MDLFTYYIFRFNIMIFRIFPFRALYLFSDVIFLFVYHVAGYRKKVIFSNLRKSFPDKTEKEINQIARSFYHHLSDLLIESMKSFTMPEAELVKRYRFLGTETLNEVFKQGKSAICVAGHYGNWEWGGVAAGTQIPFKPVGFYKPLSNKHIDNYIQKTRVKGRSKLASITDTAATFSTDWGEPALYYMVADQSPSSSRLAYWVDFLNQETACLHGPEKYARIHNLPVFFAHAAKIKRGYYSIEFIMLEPDPSKTKMGEITARYFNKLEKVIVDNPQYYLWSHRRWKLNRNEK